MSGKTASLEQIQRWMQSVITHPGGVAQGIESSRAREHLNVGHDDLESVIMPSRALTSSARLEIYVDAYFERLLECLREEFTVVRFATGGELFDALAFGYLQHYPSRSYTLNTLGEQFPKFLAETRLHARDMPPGSNESWLDFVIELATFERLLRDVFDGPGCEGGSGIDLEMLANLPITQWGELRLHVAPCFRLRRFDHPVHAYWTAFKEEQQPGPPELQTTYLAVSRRDFIVERRELDELEFELLRRLTDGERVARAINGVAELRGVDWETLERGVSRWFRQWVVARFFGGYELTGASG